MALPSPPIVGPCAPPHCLWDGNSITPFPRGNTALHAETAGMALWVGPSSSSIVLLGTNKKYFQWKQKQMLPDVRDKAGKQYSHHQLAQTQPSPGWARFQLFAVVWVPKSTNWGAESIQVSASSLCRSHRPLQGQPGHRIWQAFPYSSFCSAFIAPCEDVPAAPAGAGHGHGCLRSKEGHVHCTRVQLLLGDGEQRVGNAFTCMSELVKLQADK